MSKTKRQCTSAEYQNDAYFKRLYGKDAIVTRLGQVNIVHLDHPSTKEIQNRIEETIREGMSAEVFFDSCPLCRELQKHPHDIVYY